VQVFNQLTAGFLEQHIPGSESPSSIESLTITQKRLTGVNQKKGKTLKNLEDSSVISTQLYYPPSD